MECHYDTQRFQLGFVRRARRVTARQIQDAAAPLAISPAARRNIYSSIRNILTMTEEKTPDPQEDKTVVTLASADGETFVLPYKAAIQSVLVKDTLPGADDDFVTVGDDEEESLDNQEAVFETIEIPRVSGACLGMVVEFLKHHAIEPVSEIPHPLPHDTFEQVRRFRKTDWQCNARSLTMPRLFHCAERGY
jgi:hypothetical protein